MPPSSQQQLACAETAAVARAPAAPLRFGFPRAYLVRRLQQKMMEQLYLGAGACTIGRRGDDGGFVALDGNGDDDHEGPGFTLRLRHAAGGHQVFDHDIDLDVGILLGRYLLTARGRRFEIAFMPAMDDAQLTGAVRWIVRDLDRALPGRR
ncbi:hypothetical protein Herbaro_15305 [Herbaspirillum sp. WKF16]|uniref:hypothetical protein n=1 Tax=Herbaspirillum sp. WKF16 TaxID=3028312 RepID=UPI0023A9BEF1|nr:hypothetical protein [Herbaspirillum sp. WKF16]WDZ94846.1 hypothetical protein Herbaro_15305 [Herbaspirillum sp. WKF16]